MRNIRPHIDREYDPIRILTRSERFVLQLRIAISIIDIHCVLHIVYKCRVVHRIEFIPIEDVL